MNLVHNKNIYFTFRNGTLDLKLKYSLECASSPIIVTNHTYTQIKNDEQNS